MSSHSTMNYLEPFGFDKKLGILSGPGGVGKSYTVQSIYHYCVKNRIRIALTALTGIAATNLGGQTLHSWAGIGLAKGTHLDYVFNKRTIKAFSLTQILVIDEVSMMNVQLFELINAISQHVRKCREPFGGMCVLLVGDMCQLPPVMSTFFFKSPLFKWEEWDIKVLSIPKRYTDPDWYFALCRIRYGQPTDEDIAMIETRLVGDEEIVDENGIRPTELYPTNANVDAINLRKYEELEYKEVIFKSKDVVHTRLKNGPLHTFSTTDQDKYNKRLSVMAPQELRLKVGTQVMCTANIPKLGVFNGSRGIVKVVYTNCVDVQFVDKMVRLDTHRFEEETETETLIRYQIPLKYAWAITIHKSQSLTMDRVCINIGKTVFSHNMIYVALSRCKTLEGMYIREFDYTRITVDNDALDFEEKIFELTQWSYDAEDPKLTAFLEEHGIAKLDKEAEPVLPVPQNPE